MLIVHAVLDHEVSLEDVARSRRVVHHLELLFGGYRTGVSSWCCDR